EALSLSLRSYNSLRREGIHTVGDLAARSPQDLLAIDNIGPASVEEIKRKLADRGLALSEARPGGAAGAVNGSGPAPVAADAGPWSPPDDDAIDLLSVAGGPMLKRMIPVAVVAVAGTVIALRIRARRRRSRA